MTAIEPGSAVAARLETERLGWLTTVRADGQPQASYVWFHFDGTDLLIFSQPNTGKTRNIGTQPRVSFHLNGDSAGGGVLTIDGTAEILSDPVTSERAEAYVAKYDDRIRNGLNTTPEKMLASYSIALRITIHRVRAW
jgi:PPOX class probable F420-dependent enzyme